MAASDTNPKIEAMQLKAFRSMSAGQRLLMGMETSLLTRELMKAGVRQEHPEWTERQVMLEVLRLLFFPSLAVAHLDAMKAAKVLQVHPYVS